MNNKNTYKKQIIKHDFNTTRQSQSGLSLVELLIAMTLGIFLLTGVLQASQANKQANRVQKALEQTQKNELVISEVSKRPNFLYQNSYIPLSLEISSPPPKQVL